MPRIGRGAGEYNNLVQCQKNVGTENADGQVPPVWRTMFKRWAMIVPRGDMEKKIFDQLRAEVDHLVRIRFDSQAVQIQPADWQFLTEDGTVLNIDSRTDTQRRRIELEFRCMEVQARS